ncbi:hypothetical protein KIPB_004180, partial [Kipferlia bialata]
VLEAHGMSKEDVEKMSYLGISGIANVLGLIKMAKYYELTEKDVMVTVATDSAAMYMSRLKELTAEHGEYTELNAECDMERLKQITVDWMEELTYAKRKRVHHLKYYTWIEQQGKTLEELNAQWYDRDTYWPERYASAERLNDRINAFNDRTGLMAKLYPKKE